MDDSEFRSRLGIDVKIVEIWIEEGWVRPDDSRGTRRFGEVDLARGQLILDLTDRMGVNDAGVDLVMELIDQLHGLRCSMRSMMAAIECQDDETRLRIIRRLNGD